MTEGQRLLEALARAREDHQFFSHFFLNRKLHDGQLEFVQNGDATINVLATANRWGKTTVLCNIHYHGCIFKVGAEPRYVVDGRVDLAKLASTKYHTVHTAGDWETTRLVWDEALKLKDESVRLRALIKAAPLSTPPHIDFITGSRWKFRTLGHDASGIDGNSFYIVSIDEAGWITGLEDKTNNVIRVRVADVQGRIYYVGTFKPGVSKDFYKVCVRASAHTGRGLSFDHRSDVDEDESGGLDASIRKYLAEYGISLDEFEDALGRAA